MSFEQELVSVSDETQKRDLFHRIYEQYYKLVWFCVYRFLGNKPDTDEVADDVFVKFFFRMGKSAIDNVKFYLTRSARNLSFNKIRAKKPTVELSESIAGEYNFACDNGLLAEIKKLTTPTEFDLLCSHVLEGYTLVEIAEKTGSSANAVKSRYLRLVKHLKKSLSDFNID